MRPTPRPRMGKRGRGVSEKPPSPAASNTDNRLVKYTSIVRICQTVNRLTERNIGKNDAQSEVHRVAGFPLARRNDQ